MKKRINNFRLFESATYGTWISCEEQLPEDGQEVLVYGSNTEIDMASFRGNIEPRLLWSDFKDERYNKKPYAWGLVGRESLPGQSITHWMPLPEKP